MPNTNSMNAVLEQLRKQIRQQEIRLDIMKTEKTIRFFVEEDERAMIMKIIEQKIAHLRNSCTELEEDYTAATTVKKLPTSFY